MKRIQIEDIYEIADLMVETAIECKKNVSFIGLYEDTINLTKALMTYDEVIIHRIDIEPTDLDGYDKEYYVDLDEDGLLWVGKQYSKEHDGYLYGGSEVVFVADDCNSKLLEKLDYHNIYEVGYESDDECDCCECCECDGEHEVITRVAVNDDGKLRGFEKSWSTDADGYHYHTTYTYYSNNEDMLKNMLKNFNIKY